MTGLISSSTTSAIRFRHSRENGNDEREVDFESTFLESLGLEPRVV
jgi:hypothetical protein